MRDRINYYHQKLSQKVIQPDFKIEVQKKLPYFSQWESPALVKDFVTDSKLPRTDPLWRNSGAESPIEYEYFSFHLCGVACMKMILKHKNISIKTIPTAKALINYKAYIPNAQPKLDKHFRTNPNQIRGLYYQPFLQYVKDTYGISGTVYQFLSLKKIKQLLSSSRYVMASVNPNIRDNDISQRVEVGGHLILITGFTDTTISFHNPSGFNFQTQQNHIVNTDYFNHFFAHKGIAIN